MGRSKAAQSRKRRKENEEEELEQAPAREAEARMLTTEGLFRAGEELTQHEIESRIEQSGLVKRADDEFFRLVKARYFKRLGGKYRVRGD